MPGVIWLAAATLLPGVAPSAVFEEEHMEEVDGASASRHLWGSPSPWSPSAWSPSPKSPAPFIILGPSPSSPSPTFEGGPCVGDAATFESDIGEACDDYGPDAAHNHDNCAVDRDSLQGYVAAQVCPQCGVCDGTSLPTACQDSEGGATDGLGYGCAWSYSPSWPSLCGVFDDPDFTAADMCCACQPAGLSPSPDGCQSTAGGATDSEGYGCDNYTNVSSCTQYDDSDFTSVDMCCECREPSPECQDSDGLARDVYDYGCWDYEFFPWLCGHYDDSDFTSSNMCCSCASAWLGPTPAWSWSPSPWSWSPSPPSDCQDAEGSALDSTFMNCADGYDMSWFCGNFDDYDFTASLMCCGCGWSPGGWSPSPSPDWSPSGGPCQSTAGGATDISGYRCDEGYTNAIYCSYYDDFDFTSTDMCCECQGGAPPGPEPEPAPEPSSPSPDCQDSGTKATDDWGYGCDDGYAGMPWFCGGYDDEDFTAADLCCNCLPVGGGGGSSGGPAGGGGASPGPSVCQDGTAQDSYYYGCADGYTGMPWYCGFYDDDDFTASHECCECSSEGGPAGPGPAPATGSGGCQDCDGSATDQDGYTCSTGYTGMPFYCGGYDDEDFSSDDMCCECGSTCGIAGPGPGLCQDSEGAATDQDGYNCDNGYTDAPWYCGDFDDRDFTASLMCCECGSSGGPGGPSSPSTSCQDSEGDSRDDFGYACDDGYLGMPWYCGAYDDGDFSAYDMCCECKSNDCQDSAGAATDADGYTCAHGYTDSSFCGFYDDEDFTSSDMCCTCQHHGIDWWYPTSPSSKGSPSPWSWSPSPRYSECQDNVTSAKDSFGYGCDDGYLTTWFCGYYDDEDFTASLVCCICGNAGDSGGWGGMWGGFWSPSPSSPSPGPLTWTSSDFGGWWSPSPGSPSSSPSPSCQDSEGSALDAGFFGCFHGYQNSESYCGYYDDSDFTASDMCCACVGAEGLPPSPSTLSGWPGWWWSPSPSTGDPGCQNTEGPAKDADGFGCQVGYEAQTGGEMYCGNYDDSDFTAEQMCCICGRPAAATSPCSGDAATFSAGFGGCEVYEDENYYYCDVDFDLDTKLPASSVCPQCGKCHLEYTVDPDCEDTAGYASDSKNFGCHGGYSANEPWFCGSFDDSDFTASEMCCACKGGAAQSPSPKPMMPGWGSPSPKPNMEGQDASAEDATTATSTTTQMYEVSSSVTFVSGGSLQEVEVIVVDMLLETYTDITVDKLTVGLSDMGQPQARRLTDTGERLVEARYTILCACFSIARDQMEIAQGLSEDPLGTARGMAHVFAKHGKSLDMLSVQVQQPAMHLFVDPAASSTAAPEGAAPEAQQPSAATPAPTQAPATAAEVEEAGPTPAPATVALAGDAIGPATAESNSTAVFVALGAAVVPLAICGLVAVLMRRRRAASWSNNVKGRLQEHWESDADNAPRADHMTVDWSNPDADAAGASKQGAREWDVDSIARADQMTVDVGSQGADAAGESNQAPSTPSWMAAGHDAGKAGAGDAHADLGPRCSEATTTQRSSLRSDMPCITNV